MNEKETIVTAHVIYNETMTGGTKEEHFRNLIGIHYEEHGAILVHQPSSGDECYTACVSTFVPYQRIEKVAIISLSPIEKQ